jgi:hypothetical protein
MKLLDIFQEVDNLCKLELLNYGTYIVVPFNKHRMYISYTFRLNNYRLCYIIYNKHICILAKKIGSNTIYTGYTECLRLLNSENLGGLRGLNHVIPYIVLTHKWKYDNILDHLLIYFNNVFKISAHKAVLDNYLNLCNFSNHNYVADDDNGLNEYERIYDKWVDEQIGENLTYIDI